MTRGRPASWLPVAAWPFAVWLALVSATFVSWRVHALPAGPGGAVRVEGLVLMGVALFKIRLVLLHFMELRRAPVVWRLVFEAWIIVLGVALLVTYIGHPSAPARQGW